MDEKGGIVSIFLNVKGNLVVEYSGGQSKNVEDNNLTPEQKEIKEFFQATGETNFNRGKLEEAVNRETNQANLGKNKNNDKD
ncbi:MAG: hypothetical protein NY202_03160 [Mollicutes bacterium UO1]